MVPANAVPLVVVRKVTEAGPRELPVLKTGMVATPSLFRLLRVNPAHGRLFTEDEGTIDHEARIIITDGLWHEPEYAGKILAEPEVLGVQDLGVSNVTIRLSVKTEPLAQWDVARQLRQRIKTSFDEARHSERWPWRAPRSRATYVRRESRSTGGLQA